MGFIIYERELCIRVQFDKLKCILKRDCQGFMVWLIHNFSIEWIGLPEFYRVGAKRRYEFKHMVKIPFYPESLSPYQGPAFKPEVPEPFSVSLHLWSVC